MVVSINNYADSHIDPKILDFSYLCYDNVDTENVLLILGIPKP